MAFIKKWNTVEGKKRMNADFRHADLEPLETQVEDVQDRVVDICLKLKNDLSWRHRFVDYQQKYN